MCLNPNKFYINVLFVKETFVYITITNIITFRDCRTRTQLFSLTVSTHARVIFLSGKEVLQCTLYFQRSSLRKKCLFCVFQTRGKKTPKWRLDLKQAQGEGRVTYQSRIARSSPPILSPLLHSYPLRPFCLRFPLRPTLDQRSFSQGKDPIKSSRFYWMWYGFVFLSNYQCFKFILFLVWCN